VSVRGVEKTFVTRSGRQVRALAPIDLDVDEGEFVAVVGPSGCGKSTLLAIVAGLEAASAGEVRIGGTRVASPYHDLGIVFQKDLLLEWRTVLDNVLIQAEVRDLDKRAATKVAADLLAQVGLAGFERQYPYELSGGMRQRVSICRALLHDPALLLLDEPFAALDALTRDQMALDFQSLGSTRNKTVFFITHSIPEAVFLADTVVVFSARPGSIADVVRIELPRPRRLAMRESSQFVEYVGKIQAIFQEQGILREDG
jgi:NitT/TauT family transport system ATP-binding protein